MYKQRASHHLFLLPNNTISTRDEFLPVATPLMQGKLLLPTVDSSELV
jgi:hypothetical protein